jgi:hypothetical protein
VNPNGLSLYFATIFQRRPLFERAAEQITSLSSGKSSGLTTPREAIDRYEKSDPPEQARIKGRIREMVKHRRDDYDPDGRVDIAEAFVVQIDEGDL